MIETLVFILAGGRGDRLYPLTRDRAKPAVPFGGSYRIVDFPLSNCINSNLRQVYVLTQYKTISLDRHINLGWSILSTELGEHISILSAQQRISEDWYRGTADAVFQNIYTLERERSRLVLILAGDHIYKMDYRPLIAFHRASGAEVTVAALDVPLAEAGRFGVLEVDEERRVVSFAEKPAAPRPIPGCPERALVSMGIYLFNTEHLVREVTADAKDRHSAHDFGRDILPRVVAEKKPVYAFPFQDWSGGERRYWRDVGTIEAYYEASMDLVAVSPELNLYDAAWPIRGYQAPLPPAKTVFQHEGRTGQVIDSLICHGAIVSGARVERSIVGSQSFIHSYSQVSDAVIMEGVDIGRNCRVRRAIIDKHVVLPEGCTIGFDAAADRRRFTVTSSGIVVVPERMVV